MIVAVDPRYFRPAEVETLLGDPSKAHEKLGWKPEITLSEMVSEMVANDLEAAKKTLTAEISRLRGGHRAGVLRMNKQRIFVAGHRGMVGSAIVRQLAPRGVELVLRTRDEAGSARRARGTGVLCRGGY